MASIWTVWDDQTSNLGVSGAEFVGLSFLNGALSQFRRPPEDDRQRMFLLPTPAWSDVELLGSRMGSGGILRPLEEFIFRLGVNIPMREIRLPGVPEPITFMRPQDHGLLLAIDDPTATMWSAHIFLRSFLDAIGQGLQDCGFDAQEAHLAAILYIQIESATDRQGMATAWQQIGRLSTPMYRFFTNFQLMGSVEDLRQSQPLQNGFRDFGSGLSDDLVRDLGMVLTFLMQASPPHSGLFMQYAPPDVFFSSCMTVLADFDRTHPDVLGQINVAKMLQYDDLLAPGDFDLAAQIITQNWGLPTRLEALPSRLDRVLLNVCVFYTACAMYCTQPRRATSDARNRQADILTEPSAWPQLPQEDLQALMRRMFMLYGKDQDSHRRADVERLYTTWAEKSSRPQRHRFLQGLTAEVVTGHVGWWVLMPFLFVEQHPSVIAAAAHLVTGLYPGQGDPLAGARFLSGQLNRIPQIRPTRLGVLSSLLFAGDSRFAEMIHGKWRDLTAQRRLQFLTVTPPLCTVGLMSFLLEWLENTDSTVELNAIVKMIGRAADNEQLPGVIDLHLTWNSETNDGFEQAVQSHTSTTDYLQHILPRLIAVARAQPQATELRAMLGAIGVELPTSDPSKPLSETDVLEQWVLVPVTDIPSWDRSSASDIDGDMALGFVYVDQEAGTTLHIEQVGWSYSERFISQGSPADRQQRTLFRFSPKWLQASTLLPDQRRRRLKLPPVPSWLSVYNTGAPHTMRQLRMLHPFRLPGFPDHVETLLLCPNDQIEKIYVRLHSFQSGVMWGTLLSAPTLHPSLPAGTRVTLGMPSIETKHPVLISALPK
jgi:hypothetical protein